MNFEKSIHTALWGSESWEISAHSSDPSVIEDGETGGADGLDECFAAKFAPCVPLKVANESVSRRSKIS